MRKLGKVVLTWLFGATLAGAIIAPAAYAGDAGWRVGKASGEVWITRSGVQPVALSNSEPVAPGDIVRTGRNGRVLLTRGEETILVSADAQIEIAREADKGGSTILQKAGSILLEVEKRNVDHFAVQTPYLAAVVKGTTFRVTVGDDGGSVEVLNGQVEVKDYRSGQFALVKSDQTARVSARGPGGIALAGSGDFSPIRQGTPGAASRRLAPPLGAPTAPERHTDAARGMFTSPPDASHAKPPQKAADGAGKGGHGTVWTGIEVIPAVVGVTVALGVGVVRVRRHNRAKPDKDRRPTR